MKFEQVLQIYWTKGFLFGGRVFPFAVNWARLSDGTSGIGIRTKIKLIRRLELTSFFYDRLENLTVLTKESRRSVNRILSKMSSINFQVTELNKLNIIRLFLIKSFRGKAQAMGKPSRGQRTWSNAWTAYLYNRDLRKFIGEVQRQLNKDKKEEKN